MLVDLLAKLPFMTADKAAIVMDAFFANGERWFVVFHTACDCVVYLWALYCFGGGNGANYPTPRSLA